MDPITLPLRVNPLATSSEEASFRFARMLIPSSEDSCAGSTVYLLFFGQTSCPQRFREKKWERKVFKAWAEPQKGPMRGAGARSPTYPTNRVVLEALMYESSHELTDRTGYKVIRTGSTELQVASSL